MIKHLNKNIRNEHESLLSLVDIYRSIKHLKNKFSSVAHYHYKILTKMQLTNHIQPIDYIKGNNEEKIGNITNYNVS